MKIPKLILGFSKYSDAALDAKTVVIITAMTGNINFPLITMPALNVITDARNAFADALALASGRDKLKVALKNQMRAALISNLRTLGHFVTLNSNQSRAIMLSSGFDVTAEFTVVKTLGTPQNFAVKPGANSGILLASVDSLPGARTYTCLYNLAAQTVNGWFPLYNTIGEFEIPGLTPGTMVSVKIDIVRTKTDVAHTDIITKMVV